MLLNRDQISKVKEHLTELEDQNSSLSVDILDHICCMIEERVESGINLQNAENEVLYKMGKSRIKDIRIETAYLVQDKITMKKRTKIIGVLTIVTLITGLGLKVLHLPGAAIAWGVGVLLATFGFSLLLFVDNFSVAKSTVMKISHTLGYIGASGILLGFGFKFLHLPFAADMVFIGGFILLIYFIMNNVFAREEVSG